MNENLLEKNKRVYKKLNIPVWHKAGIKGNGVNIAVIGYGACLSYKKPYIRQVNKFYGGSYHDGDEIIHNVAPQATIYSINMKDKDGWSFKKCLEWVVKHKPDVVCLSFKIHHLTNEEKDLIEQAYNNGTIMIASTGNDNSYVAYPAKNKHWIGVGAYSELFKSKASYSNYGEGLDCLGYTNFGVEAQPGYYMQISHTSGATQAIAGMATLLKEHLLITPGEFKQFIAKNCIDLGPKGWDKETGHGLLVLPKKIPERKEEIKVNKPQYIIIHHSGTENGNADIFRRSHKAKGWRDIGYHYIIGNGTNSKDGLVEKGRVENTSGAHCNNDRMNFRSIGICLVGNFEKQKPTNKQLQSLEKLVRGLMNKYKIQYTRVLGHKEVKGASTACPGKNFDMKGFRLSLKEDPRMAKKDYKGHWAESSIKKAESKGIMSGYPDGEWKPEKAVTRAELAAILDRLGLLDLRR